MSGGVGERDAGAGEELDHPERLVDLAVPEELRVRPAEHGGEIFSARSTDGGRTFEEPLNPSNTLAGDGKGRLDARLWDNGSHLALGPEGHVYAAWTEYEGALWLSRSADGGRSFSAPLRVAGGPGERPARGPSLAVGAGGVVHLAWTVGEDPAADVHLATSEDGGRSFGPARVAAESAAHSDAPRIALGRDGALHLVYAEGRPGSRRSHVRYTRRPAGAPGFEEPRPISGPADDGVGAGYPVIALDAQDRVSVAWERFPGDTWRSVGLGLTRSSDGGRTFAAPVVVPGTGDPADGMSGSQQGLFMRKLAVSPGGAIAVVNSTFRPGVASRIRLILGRPGAE